MRGFFEIFVRVFCGSMAVVSPVKTYPYGNNQPLFTGEKLETLAFQALMDGKHLVSYPVVILFAVLYLGYSLYQFRASSGLVRKDC